MNALCCFDLARHVQLGPLGGCRAVIAEVRVGTCASVRPYFLVAVMRVLLTVVGLVVMVVRFSYRRQQRGGESASVREGSGQLQSGELADAAARSCGTCMGGVEAWNQECRRGRTQLRDLLALQH